MANPYPHSEAALAEIKQLESEKQQCLTRLKNTQERLAFIEAKLDALRPLVDPEA